ncbi:uncharacterized protein LOC131893159 [Tigriopus californicus]|nr:uncharacterized protein LOC131893159 [Tigriopus californicus]|eukprot:TCALIF_11604-PA protein Name:"Protein of unknown function" AED:0.15 eAED:0.15 QI:16/0.66/0.14/1/0.83/0.85/7/0/734
MIRINPPRHPHSHSVPLLLTLTLVMLSPGALVRSQNCPTRDVTFELITGYVFTAPEFILDTRPGVLLLEECIEVCRQNVTCASVNYETGLCVLFMASARNNPGSLSRSQFPVFTLFAQKTCVRSARTLCPGRGWIFDRVQDFKMLGFARETRPADTVEDCMAQCLSQITFTCRSANFDTLKLTCEISDMDRHTVNSRNAFFPAIGIDYLENNCAEKPSSVCNFKPIKGQILKTVDSVFANIGSQKECEQLCVSSTYRCHSYDYGDTGTNICRMSHHSSETLRNIREPYLSAAQATTYELTSCFNVSVDCQANYMIAKVHTNRVFNGKIYGKTRPNSCTINVENKLDFELYLGFNDIDCDVKQETPGRFGSDVIIQHHDMIVTGEDVGLKVRCNYNLSNTTIVSDTNLSVKGGLNIAGAENTVVRSPNVTLRVTDRLGLDILSAQVGDALALRFEIVEKESPYEIFVRDLVAMDGLDSSEIVLIDSRGCPTDFSILGAIKEVEGSGKVLQSDFDAFKFPTSDLVQFRALVTPCIPRCDPVQCDVTDYYGKRQTTSSFGRRRRRRRRQIEGQDTGSKSDLMVAGVIRISDKFELASRKEQPDTLEREIIREDTHNVWTPQDSPEHVSCLNTVSFSIGATIFVFVQCVILGAWTYLYYRRERKKSEDSLASSLCSRSSSEDLDPYFVVPIPTHHRPCSDLSLEEHRSSRSQRSKLQHLEHFGPGRSGSFRGVYPRDL